MFYRIIVATDLSPATRAALRVALHLLSPGGRIVLVHVIRRIRGVRGPDVRALEGRLAGVARERMLDLARPFVSERGVGIACEVAYGPPAQVLARLARQKQTDLIVLAHHPRAADPAPGGISYRVVQLAPCAVLILKAPARLRPTASSRGRRATRRA
ncbi:MAG TPA: universal stress protein [Vicinamibacterales bacterium]